jgi:hypothetical protein
MSEKNNELAHHAAICKQISYELLVRTVVRLAPDLTAEIEKSAQEFLADNNQPTTEANEFFAQTVELVANALVESTNNQTNETQKESNHE